MSSSSKRKKMDMSPTDWDDDEDIDMAALDECFERASQRIQEEHPLQESFVLPDYSAFKQAQITSTQVSQSFSNLESQLVEYRIKYAEKAGEASILRANLDRIKSTTCQQSSKDVEWSDKLNKVQAQYDEVKSKLELKNFENADLKKKIRFLQTNASKSGSTSIREKREGKKIEPKVDLSISLIINKERYPLKECDFTFVFCPLDQAFCETRKSGDEIFLNQFTKVEKVKINSKPLGIDSIYPEMNVLIKYSKDELNSEVATKPITKIIFFMLYFLEKLNIYLEIFEDNVQPFEIKRKDYYIKNNFISKKLGPGDVRLKLKEEQCAKILTFLTAVIPYNQYLFDTIVNNKDLKVDENCDYYHYLKLNKQKLKCNLLNMLSKAIAFIGKLRKTILCGKFFRASSNFLTALYDSGEINNSGVELLLNNTVKEIIFARPDDDTMVEVIYLLEAATKNDNFVKTLCVNNARREKAYVFTRNMCTLHMFILLVKNLFEIAQKDEQLYFKCSDPFCNFIINLFKSDDPLMTLRIDRGCDCFQRLYTLYCTIFSNILDTLDGNIMPCKSFLLKNMWLLDHWKRTFVIYTNGNHIFHAIVAQMHLYKEELELEDIDFDELMSDEEVEDVDLAKFKELGF